MKVKAKISFAGRVSMGPGEVRDVPKDIAAPLINCGYVESMEDPATPDAPETPKDVKEAKSGKKE